MPSRILIAIDPGSDGGVAWRDAAGEIHVVDLPRVSIELKSRRANGKHKERTIVDSHELAVMLDDIACPRIVESVGTTIGVEALLAGAAKMSAFSALLQGANFGRVEGVAHAVAGDRLDREVRLIESKKWRAFHGLDGDTYEERKALAVLKALELYPRHEIITCPAMKVTKSGKPSKRQPKAEAKSGRADALLMLAYMIHEHEREGR